MRRARKEKRITCLLFALLLVLTACGAESPEAGRYICVEAADGSYGLDPASLYPDGASIELGSGGRGILTLGERSGSIRWSLSDNELTLNIDGERFSGTLEDGILDLTLPDSGVQLRFVREDVNYSPAGAPEAERMAEALDWWTGDWYGKWYIQNAEGSFVDTWYDCCASIEAEENGTHVILSLWDEDSSREEPMGRVEFAVKPGALPGNRGTAVSTSGSFWFSTVEAGQWTLDPRRSGYADMLRLTGHHESEKESFDYEILLRPWGRLWDDVAKKDPDMLPFRYEWYLEQIERNEPMPAKLPAVD